MVGFRDPGFPGFAKLNPNPYTSINPNSPTPKLSLNPDALKLKPLNLA